MRKDVLEEIDALLNKQKNQVSRSSPKEPVIRDYLSPIEQDAIGEIGNISLAIPQLPYQLLRQR